MALVKTDLSLLAYGAGNSLWFYGTNDLATVVDTSGYFNNVSDMVQVGDLIFAHVDKDGTPGFGVFAVTANAGGVVDVADLTNFAATDTD